VSISLSILCLVLALATDNELMPASVSDAANNLVICADVQPYAKEVLLLRNKLPGTTYGALD